MKPVDKVLLTLAVAGLLFTTGCGSDSEDPRDQDPPSSSSSSSAASESTSESVDAERQATYDQCADLINGLTAQLEKVNSRRHVGLDLNEYGDLLSDARVAHDDMVAGIGEVHSGSCIEEVAAPLKDALNLYNEAYDSWEACKEREDVGGFECVVDEVLFVQRRWRHAADLIEASAVELGQLEPN